MKLLESNVFLPLHIFKQAMSPRCMIHWWAVSGEKNQSLLKEKKILEFLWSFQHHLCCFFRPKLAASHQNKGGKLWDSVHMLCRCLRTCTTWSWQLYYEIGYTGFFFFLLIFPPAHALCTTPVIKKNASHSFKKLYFMRFHTHLEFGGRAKQRGWRCMRMPHPTFFDFEVDVYIVCVCASV